MTDPLPFAIAAAIVVAVAVILRLRSRVDGTPPTRSSGSKGRPSADKK